MTDKVPAGVVRGDDGKLRCKQPNDSVEYRQYHDCEWGVPVDNDIRLYEKICLEGFQSGLSWFTILKKRENFRAAFDDFDFEKVAKYTDKDIKRLIANEGIIRNRQKIESTINNAQRACELLEEYDSLAAYFWQYEPKPESRPSKIDLDTFTKLTQTPESEALSKDLKQRGWTYVGAITAYAFMQALGMVNDHIEGCEFRNRITQLRQDFVRPTMKSKK